MRGEWRFHAPEEIIFGLGTVHRVGEVARRVGAGRVLLITDVGLVAAGLHQPVETSLAGEGIAVDLWDQGQAKPTVDLVAACAGWAQKRSYDVIVALGGGSNIDLAKAVAVILAHGGEASGYFGEDQVPGPVLPLIAISTTAGTGSEVSGASVLADPARGRRGAILSNRLRPRVAIYDPLLTQTCPRAVTADAGIDALTHAIEAYMVLPYDMHSGGEQPYGVYQGRYPLSDLMAEEAIALIGRNLRRAVYRGADLAAREAMHLASLLAGMAFSNAGLTAVHALEYPVGAATGCSHGAGNGLFLPYVMEYNLPACAERLAVVAGLLGENTEGLSARDAGMRAVEAVHTLKREIGIPMRLRELGVKEDQLPALAEATAQVTRLLEANPRPLDVSALEGILRRAW